MKTEKKLKYKIPEYSVWRGIKARCSDSNRKDAHLYVNKGIRVSDEWAKDFWKFYEDLGPRPSSKHSIERIDSNKNYCKENCKWATATEQARNTSQNHLFTYNGETLCLNALVEKYGIKRQTFNHRRELGWDLDRILTTKPNQGKKKVVNTDTGEIYQSVNYACLKLGYDIRSVRRYLIGATTLNFNLAYIED